MDTILVYTRIYNHTYIYVCISHTNVRIDCGVVQVREGQTVFSFYSPFYEIVEYFYRTNFVDITFVFLIIPVNGSYA